MKLFNNSQEDFYKPSPSLVTNNNSTKNKLPASNPIEEPTFGDKFRMFCEYDNDVYRNYKLGKMIKIFYEERIKNEILRQQSSLTYVHPIEIKSLTQSVREQLKDKNANELWEVLIEQ